MLIVKETGAYYFVSIAMVKMFFSITSSPDDFICMTKKNILNDEISIFDNKKSL